MLLDVQAHPAELPALFNQFMQITGVEPWVRKEQEFEKQIRGNPFFKGYLDIKFALERCMMDVRRYKKSTGRMPPFETAELGALYSFIAMTARVFRHLPDEGKGALRASLIGALKSDIGLAPFAFEIRTAAHLMAMGGDVEFHDLCGGGGYDFLVSRGGIEMEVECKSFSADLGRPIHLLRQYQLGYYLQPAMQLPHKEGSIQLLVATLADRLHPQREFMEAVATRIREALENGTSIESDSPCSVSYHRFPISGSPFDCGTPVRIDEQEVVDHCNKASGENIGHVLIVFQPKRYAIVIGLQSRQPNRPLKTIERTLRDAAARQLSAKRPGIICVQFRNMTNNELKELANAPWASGEPSGLQIMTTHFLRKESRDHIHTVAYVAPGNFVERRSVKRDFLTADLIRSTDISEDAASYTFTNPRNPMATDARYAFF